MAAHSISNQYIRHGTAHTGTPVQNQYHFEWTTSECEDTGNLIDELHIKSDENATTLHKYYTYLQDHSSQHTRRIIYSNHRFPGASASATTSCESLASYNTEK